MINVNIFLQTDSYIQAQTPDKSDSLVLKIADFLGKEDSIPFCFKTSSGLRHNVARNLIQAKYPWHFEFAQNALENAGQPQIDWIRCLKERINYLPFPMVMRTLSSSSGMYNGAVIKGERILSIPFGGYEYNGFVDYNSDFQDPRKFPEDARISTVTSFTALRRGGFATVGQKGYTSTFIRIWDQKYNFVKEKIYRKSELHPGIDSLWIYELENEKLVAGSTWSNSMGIHIWDAQSDQAQTIEVGDQVHSALALPENQLAIGGVSEINVWDLSNDLSSPAPKEPVRRYGKNPDRPQYEQIIKARLICLATLSDGRFVSGDSGGFLRLWNSNGIGFMAIQGSQNPITSMIALRGKEVFYGNSEGKIAYWGLKDMVFPIEQHTQTGPLRRTNVVWLKEFPNRHLVSCSGDGQLMSISVDEKGFIKDYSLNENTLLDSVEKPSEEKDDIEEGIEAGIIEQGSFNENALIDTHPVAQKNSCIIL